MWDRLSWASTLAVFRASCEVWSSAPAPSDHCRSALISGRFCLSHLTPPWGIPDWRRLERNHPKVIPDWRRFQRFGTNWRRFQGFPCGLSCVVVIKDTRVLVRLKARSSSYKLFQRSLPHKRILARRTIQYFTICSPLCQGKTGLKSKIVRPIAPQRKWRVIRREVVVWIARCLFLAPGTGRSLHPCLSPGKANEPGPGAEAMG